MEAIYFNEVNLEIANIVNKYLTGLMDLNDYPEKFHLREKGHVQVTTSFKDFFCFDGSEYGIDSLNEIYVTTKLYNISLDTLDKLFKLLEDVYFDSKELWLDDWEIIEEPKIGVCFQYTIFTTTIYFTFKEESGNTLEEVIEEQKEDGHDNLDVSCFRDIIERIQDGYDW